MAPLPPDLRSRVVQLVQTVGVTLAMEELGLHTPTLRRVLRGEPVRPKILARVQAALDLPGGAS